MNDAALDFSPDPAAQARLARKRLVTTDLDSAQIAALPRAAREAAFFSAKVQDARTLAALKSQVQQALDLTGNDTRAAFVANMRKLIGGATGNVANLQGDSGQLTDITSGRRLGLIYDHQLTEARARSAWLREQTPALLDEYPCQELVRTRPSRHPRSDWGDRWAAAGGQTFGVRMIARKDDPVWESLSRFGTPYPPFDYGSGMGLRNMDRETSVALGVIQAADIIEPTATGHEWQVEHEWKDADPQTRDTLLDYMREHFGDAVKEVTDKDGSTRLVLNTPLRLKNIDKVNERRERLRTLLPSLPEGTGFEQAVSAATTITDSTGRPVTLDLHHLDNQSGKDRTYRKKFLPAALDAVRTAPPVTGPDGNLHYTRFWERDGFTYGVEAIVGKDGALFDYFDIDQKKAPGKPGA
jgi:hypothetical protein